MFTRAPGGADMIADFKPFMRPEKVTEIQGYFLTIGSAEGDLRLHVLPDAAAAGDQTPTPAVAALNEQWGRISGEMAPMIGTMADNVDRFAGIAALPPFWLFPWFFVLPGALVIACTVVAARSGGPEAETSRRVVAGRPARLRWKERDMTTTAATPTGTDADERPSLFSFPNPVNEVSARLVATGVVLMAATIIVFDVRWLTLVLAYGFIARVLTGPSLSPLGQLVTRVVTPRLAIAPRYVAGPPKRFAQAIGVVFSVTAAVLTYAVGSFFAAQVVLGLLLVAASLEAFAGICLGCWAFGLLMKAGVVPEEVCERCNDIWGTGTADSGPA